MDGKELLDLLVEHGREGLPITYGSLINTLRIVNKCNSWGSYGAFKEGNRGLWITFAITNDNGASCYSLFAIKYNNDTESFGSISDEEKVIIVKVKSDSKSTCSLLLNEYYCIKGKTNEDTILINKKW